MRAGGSSACSLYTGRVFSAPVIRSKLPTTPGGGRFQKTSHKEFIGTAVLPPPRFLCCMTASAASDDSDVSDSSDLSDTSDLPDTSDQAALHAPLHEPVMVSESLQYLNLAPGKIVVDATLGCGGHARHILPAILPGGLLIGIDRDAEMLRIARAELSEFPRESYRLFEAVYSRLDDVLREVGIDTVDAILLDAGFSSAQVDDPARGFSFKIDGPLDMRYSHDATSAVDLVNNLPQKELERIFHEFGEERWSRRIAERIVRERRKTPILRTLQLAEIILRAVPPRRHKLHPATRCFQALRIAANRELEHLEKFLPLALSRLRPDGRIVVIAYHSLEDRLVKRAFLAGKAEGRLRIETKRVVPPSWDEVARNARSRSARLRAATVLSLPMGNGA